MLEHTTEDLCRAGGKLEWLNFMTYFSSKIPQFHESLKSKICRNSAPLIAILISHFIKDEDWTNLFHLLCQLWLIGSGCLELYFEKAFWSYREKINHGKSWYLLDTCHALGPILNTTFVLIHFVLAPIVGVELTSTFFKEHEKRQVTT